MHTLDEDDEEIQAATQSPVFPTGAHIAHHNPQPAPSFWNSQPQRGRLYDHERESAPPLPRGSVRDTSSRWKAFTSSSMYPRTSTDLDQETVSEEWLTQHGADYSQPWLEGGDEDDVEKGKMSAFKSHIKRRAWYLRLQRTLLRSPVIPLIVRMINFSFSMVALGLAGSIHHLTVNNRYMGSSTSTKMAIIVDAIALVYLLYIAYDEYSAKPLGLRSAKAKMRLLFLDLFFIVFDSANLSLAFEAVGDEGRCGVVCDRQEALASVLLVALIAWLLTFSISVMRSVLNIRTSHASLELIFSGLLSASMRDESPCIASHEDNDFTSHMFILNECPRERMSCGIGLENIQASSAARYYVKPAR